MTLKNSEQLQIRIDTKTKEEARKVLEGLGMDISSAVKIFLRQVINTRNFPCEIRDENGFTIRAASEMRAAVEDVRKSSESFRNTKSLFDDLLKK